MATHYVDLMLSVLSGYSVPKSFTCTIDYTSISSFLNLFFPVSLVQVCRAHCSAAVVHRYTSILRLREEDLELPRLASYLPLLQLAREIDCSLITVPGSVSPLVRLPLDLTGKPIVLVLLL